LAAPLTLDSTEKKLNGRLVMWRHHHLRGRRLKVNQPMM